MKSIYTDSVYTMEPKCTLQAWDNHWNYQWNGRNSLMRATTCKWRKESSGDYIVRDERGIVWRMDELSFQAFRDKNAYVA